MEDIYSEQIKQAFILGHNVEIVCEPKSVAVVSCTCGLHIELSGRIYPGIVEHVAMCHIHSVAPEELVVGEGKKWLEKRDRLINEHTLANERIQKVKSEIKELEAKLPGLRENRKCLENGLKKANRNIERIAKNA